MTGAELRKARQGLGLSQHDLARVLGKHPVSISRYENEREGIPKDTSLAMLYMVTYGMLEGVMEGAPVWRLPK